MCYSRCAPVAVVIERLATQGGSVLVGNAPWEFAQVIKSDLAKYAKLIKAANIQVQKKLAAKHC